MVVLSYDEIKRIRYWNSYKDDWPFDRYNPPPSYLDLRSLLSCGEKYYVKQTQHGGMGNYIEYVCYANRNPKGTNLPALLLCISLCAPVAAYSEISTRITDNAFSWGFLDLKRVNSVTSEQLKPVEENALSVLRQLHIELLEEEQLQKPIPTDLLEGGFDTYTDMDNEELIAHAIFQWYD